MNRWQIVKNLRYRAFNLTWPTGTAGGAGEKVVRTPIISPGLTVSEILGAVRAGPLVMFNAGENVPDDGSAALGVTTIPVTIATLISNDKTASAALVGAAGVRKTSDSNFGQTASQGRGLLELEEVILAGLRQGAADLGIAMQATYVGNPAAGTVQASSLAVAEYRLRVKCTADRYYHPPQRVAFSANVLSWALPPDRFDRYKIRVRYASGATAPTSPTGGSPVTLGSDLATSVNVGSLGAGTYSFAVFAAYDETRDQVLGQTLSEEQRFSAQETGSYKASCAVT